MKKTVLILFMVASATLAWSQTILNGSFETNTSACRINATSVQYDSIISDSKEIGKANQVDVMGGSASSACTSYGTAEDGTCFLGMVSDYYNDAEDAISLKLSKALSIGHTYTLSYYDRYSAPTLGCSLEFGISMTDSTFGTLMYSSPYFPYTTWTKHNVTLKPTEAAQYITVRTNTQGGGWTLVDNFQLDDITGVDELNTLNIKAEVFPNPVTEKATIRYTADQTLESADLIVFDALGNIVKRLKPATANIFEFQKENCSAGLYFYQIINNNRPVFTGKIVVE